MKHKKYFYVFVPFIAGAFMIVAGVLKLVFIDDFHSTLNEWSILPQWSLLLIIIGVPFLEIVLGLWLISSRDDWRPRVFLVALLAVFTVMVLVEKSSSGQVSCGCLGGKVLDKPTNTNLLVLRNIGLSLALFLHPSLLNRLGRYVQPKKIRVHAD